MKNISEGESSTKASGVQLDTDLQRAPIEVQIRALQNKNKDLESKLGALLDEARKKGVQLAISVDAGRSAYWPR